MQELVVLGLIPGTNIQITFELWLNTLLGLLFLYMCISARRHHYVRHALITGMVLLQTRRVDYASASTGIML
jgi:hypothetical protein